MRARRSGVDRSTIWRPPSAAGSRTETFVPAVGGAGVHLARRSGGALRRFRRYHDRRAHRGRMAGAAAPQHLLPAALLKALGWPSEKDRRPRPRRGSSTCSRRRRTTSPSRRSRWTTRRWSSRRRCSRDAARAPVDGRRRQRRRAACPDEALTLQPVGRRAAGRRTRAGRETRLARSPPTMRFHGRRRRRARGRGRSARSRPISAARSSSSRSTSSPRRGARTTKR